MASHDSDSSEDDQRSYTETNVLLGYTTSDPTSDGISRLGGHPSWLDGTSPPGELAKCKVCNSLMSLLLQLNGDLPERFPGHERRLYVFSCRRKACRRKEGSVRGFRGTRISRAEGKDLKIDNTAKTRSPESLSGKNSNIGETLFGISSVKPISAPLNPFSMPSPSSNHNPFATTSSQLSPTSQLAAKPPQKPSEETPALSDTFASKARISTKISQAPSPQASVEPWPSESSFPTPYPSYYLEADYECLDKAPTLPVPPQTTLDKDLGESSSSIGPSDDKEAFESSLDRDFQRFADRLSQNPEQVLRYEFGGKPLLYSKSDAVGRLLGPQQQKDFGGHVRTAVRGGSGMPRCGNCEGERVFEAQLTPHAITQLEADEIGLEGMDWGTVILGVCGADCTTHETEVGKVGYLEEWVGVQWEEVGKQNIA